MDTLQMVSKPAIFNGPMQDYTQWVLRVQSEADPNGIDVRTEPKYNLPNGDVFTGGWCRPQTDGPGLRALTLSNYALYLVSSGNATYVKQYLYTSNPNDKQGGAIYHDLAWVVRNWNASGCDLWEEVTSDDFFWNRITMKKALLVGAQVASTLGDSSTASSYLGTASAINDTLPSHYNGQYVFESTNREQDAAVINGFNVGYANDGMFAPTSKEVAGTIQTLNSLFTNMFSINSQDTAQGVPGILYGRYQGDSYAGGNPWILTTNALAQLLYRGAEQTMRERHLPEALHIWSDIIGHDAQRYTASNDYAGFARALALTGDGVLLRVRYHVEGSGFHLSEQLDRQTGAELSATDLTWSYATLFKAWYSRTKAMAAIEAAH
eukprot:TRINITY_DN7654_c0_g1_i1.p1 TRINITY_DN7654_c0_g1~~TRINITY_DN7654_c0_g1_i1.p1  ORF type:complete len:425 (-),score=122.80 TRINITY_DN7654_c0_g1_i1:79-1215(-)